MENQEWSDLPVVFTMILCGTNFSLCQDMGLIHGLPSNNFSESVHLISRQYDLNNELINVCFDSRAQRLVVKTTQKSDLPWSAIFSVMVLMKIGKHDLFIFITRA